MTTKVLDNVKEMLGISSDDTAFDNELFLFVNMSLDRVNQVSEKNFTGTMKLSSVNDVWSTVFGEDPCESIKTYIYINVKLLFDPPQSSYLLDALNRQKEELEFRIQVATKN